MFTGFLPMWCGIATPQQANELVNLHYLNEEAFHCASGVRSLSARETMYSLATNGNPSNWLGPVWIIVNYFVWKGLQAYGFETEARALADTTLRLLAADLAKNGSLNE
jgi:putative isomerase